MDEPMDAGIRTPQQAEQLLLSLVGTWEGANRVWFEPGVLADTTPVRGVIRALPSTSFVIHEYASSVSGEAYQGVVLYGYNLFNGQFEAAWADSGHMRTNLMFASGPGIPRGFSVLGSYMFDAAQPAWGWRTEVELRAPDHLTITAYNISPDGDESRAIEMEYQRVR